MTPPLHRLPLLLLAGLSSTAFAAAAESPAPDGVGGAGSADGAAAESASPEADSTEEVADTPSFVTPSAVSVPEPVLRGWAEELRRMLERQLELLAAIDATSSAAAAVAPLRENLQRMAELRDRVRADALRLYLDNTPETKTPFIELLQKTAVEFKRLDDADCYGCTELSSLLAPQMGQ